MPRELELKLLADEEGILDEISAYRSLAGHPLLLVEQRVQRDRYLDTAGMALLEAGLSLRLREKKGRRYATLKEIVSEDRRSVLADRREIQAAVDDGRLPSVVREVVEREIGRAELLPVVGIRTNRELIELRGRDEAVAELCLDRSEVLVAEGDEVLARFFEIEVEDRGGGRQVLARAAEELLAHPGLAPSKLSKFERGLQLLRRSDPGRDD